VIDVRVEICCYIDMRCSLPRLGILYATEDTDSHDEFNCQSVLYLSEKIYSFILIFS